MNAAFGLRHKRIDVECDTVCVVYTQHKSCGYMAQIAAVR